METRPTTNDAIAAGSSQVRAAWREYSGRGWLATPLGEREKRALFSNWPSYRTTESEMEALVASRPAINLGVVTGRESGGLVDVEADSRAAVQLVRHFLPDTDAVFGRPSKPASHHLYICDDPPRYLPLKDPTDGQMLAEVRADGHQSMVPPSVHPSGEEVRWYRRGDPARIDAGELVARTKKLAAAALVARRMQDGCRHDPLLALAAVLLKAGMPGDGVRAFLEPVVDVAGGDDGDLLRAVEDTIRKHEAGERVAGYSKLVEIYGDAVARNLADRVVELLGLDGSSLHDDRPRIDSVAGELGEKTDAAMRALVDANEPPVLYRRGDLPARIKPDDDGNPRIAPVSTDWMRDHLSRVARWYRLGRDGTRTDVHPPLDVVRGVMELVDEQLPVLRRIVAAPVFAPDGALVSGTGYNPAARVYLHPEAGLVVPPVSDEPDASELERARSLLLDHLLVDFPFVSDADRAHAVAALLLPFGRDLIAGPTPLHDIEAPAEGTGKGLLVRVLTLPSAGTAGVTAITEAGNEEEWRKRITAALLEAPAVVVLDNIRSTLNSGALASATTALEWADRALGHSRIARSAVRCLWLMTANNPTFSAEMSRRTVRIRLDARRDRPYLREGFRHELPRWAEEHRGELVCAALTLWRAWLAAGRPAGSETLGSYESWARAIGGVLDVAGIPDFLGNRSEFYSAADSESERWRDLVTAWWESHRDAAVTARQLYPLVRDFDRFRFRAQGEDGEVREFGYLLRGQKDRVYGDHLIAEAGADRRGIKRYRLVPQGEPGAAPPREALGPLPEASREPDDRRNPFGDPVEDERFTLAGY